MIKKVGQGECVPMPLGSMAVSYLQLLMISSFRFMDFPTPNSPELAAKSFFCSCFASNIVEKNRKDKVNCPMYVNFELSTKQYVNERD